MSFSKEEFEEFVIENDVIGFHNKPFTLKSGRISYDYVNWRNITEDAFLLDKLGNFIINYALEKFGDFDTLHGVAEGGTKLAVVSQHKWAMRNNYKKGSHTVSMSRGKSKSHGNPKDQFFLGLPTGRVIVVEDVTTTGGALIDALNKLKNENINIIGTISLTNRMERRDDGKSVKKAVNDLGFRFEAMSSNVDLLPKVYNYIKPKEEIVREVEKYYEKHGLEHIKLMNHDMKKLPNLTNKSNL